MVVSLLPISTMAESKTFTDKYGVWTYEEQDDGSLVIVSFVASRKNIVVPASIGGKPVKKLGDGLFQNNNELTMIVIPNGVEEIGANAFSGCAYLEQVTLPSTLTTIGDGAFSDCAVLGDVYIPSSVTEIGKDLFTDSPSVNVHCEAGTVIADYLVENIGEVASFTIVEVQKYDTPVIPAPPVNNTVAEPIRGELLTYEFGKIINGQREFVMVL